MRSQNYEILFSYDQIDITNGIRFVTSPKCGAINTFSGTIRDTDLRSSSRGETRQLEPILGIHYEAYQDMAVKQIADIIDGVTSAEADSVDPNCRVFVAIRLGFVPVGEASLIICVSSTSRSFSHTATMTILEKIKSSVVIWKKVHFQDGEIEWADSCKSEAYWLKDQDNNKIN